MVLNSSRLMPALCSRYCGIILYFSNSACHAGASSGGSTPVTGFHSTIDSPDPVSRVVPPTTKVANIRAATASSHSRMARRRVWADGVRLLMAFACRQGMRSSNEAAANAEGAFKSNNHTRRISLLVARFNQFERILVIRFRRQRLAREAIMAAKEISVKKYVVRLSGEERERLETLLRKGKSPARRVLKAR